MENDRLKKALLHSSTEESIRNKMRVDKINRVFLYMEQNGATIADVAKVFDLSEIGKMKSKKFDINTYRIEDATHFVKLSKVSGKNKIEYVNKCIIVSDTPSGLKKIVSFGTRRWQYSGHTRTMRYVSQDRLVAI